MSFFLILDVLLVLDQHLKDVHIPGARKIVLTEAQGLCDVGLLAVNQELLFLHIKVLVIITGWAEIEAEHPAMENSVLAAIERILTNVHYRKVVLAAPVPRPDASKEQLKQLFRMTRFLQFCCKGNGRLEYTKSGQMFYGPGGLYADFFHGGGLTQNAKSVLSNQLFDKINSLGFAKSK